MIISIKDHVPKYSLHLDFIKEKVSVLLECERLLEANS